MMTTRTPRSKTGSRPAESAGAAVPQSGALKLWGGLGAISVLIALTTFGRWIASPNFSAVDPGRDHYPYLWVLRSVEAVSVAMVLAFAWFCLVRPLIRERTFGFDGKLLVGLLLAFMVDPTFNAFGHNFAMNANSVNLGGWGPYLPFYSAPGQGRFPEALLWAMPLYVYCGIAAAMLGGMALRFMRSRWPRLSTAERWLILYLLFVVGDFLFEFTCFVYPQLYVFSGVKGNLSLFAGTLHQFPVYHSLAAGLYAGAVTWLRESRDDSGRSAIERGADQIKGRARTALSFLAIAGYAAAAAFLGYFLPFSYMSMKADTYIKLPSYLSAGAYCGDRGEPICPSQYLNDLRVHTKETG
jgi:hypothetical protein